MTRAYAKIDPERCARYAGFMSSLSERQTTILFAVMALILVMLISITATQYHKSNKLTERERRRTTPSICQQQRALDDKQRKMSLGITGVCFGLAVTCTVCMAFTLLNLQYCQGSELMQMYWALWGMLPVGSSVAILGVMVQLGMTMGEMEGLSWAVALGTPVLVFAALGWLCREWGKWVLKRLWWGRKGERGKKGRIWRM